jgi:hypothetical protein
MFSVETNCLLTTKAVPKYHTRFPRMTQYLPKQIYVILKLSYTFEVVLLNYDVSGCCLSVSLSVSLSLSLYVCLRICSFVSCLSALFFLRETFQKTGYLRFVRKSVFKIRVLLKYDRNNGIACNDLLKFITKSRWIFLRMRDVSNKTVERIKHISFSITFIPKTVPFVG